MIVSSRFSEFIPEDKLPPTDDEMEFSNGVRHPCWQCAICGEYSVEPFCLHQTVICDVCANAIANHYNHRHGGFWLTWPNPPVERPSYEKRKEISTSTRKRIFERDAYRCRYCGSHMNLTIDHVLPISQNGPGSDDNLVTCCKTCNSRKHGRTPEQAGMVLLPALGKSEVTEE